jgi:RNA polymerase sigma factor (sigma-70 family)
VGWYQNVMGGNQMQQAEAYTETGNYFDRLNGDRLNGDGLNIEWPVNQKRPARELHDVLASRLPSLHRSAYRLLGNTADAEDAVQDALLSACKHFDQFRGESHISTWLTAIVFNSARMRLRHQRRHVHVSLDEQIGEDQQYSLSERLVGPGPSPEEEYRNCELTGHMRQLTARLSPILRRTFHLCDINGLSIREAAEILGIPVGTVKAQLARARKKLKQLMHGTLKPRLCRGRVWPGESGFLPFYLTASIGKPLGRNVAATGWITSAVSNAGGSLHIRLSWWA